MPAPKIRIKKRRDTTCWRARVHCFPVVEQADQASRAYGRKDAMDFSQKKRTPWITATRVRLCNVGTWLFSGSASIRLVSGWCSRLAIERLGEAFGITMICIDVWSGQLALFIVTLFISVVGLTVVARMMALNWSLYPSDTPPYEDPHAKDSKPASSRRTRRSPIQRSWAFTRSRRG
jgi:hypothetical protein